MTATWTRGTAGTYVSGGMEIRRTTQSWGDACGSTTTTWWISLNGERWDALPTLAAAKRRAERVPAIARGEKCWGRNCDKAPAGVTPSKAISLDKAGDIPTCDACHRSFAGPRPR